jgi:hypothetical protein
VLLGLVDFRCIPVPVAATLGLERGRGRLGVRVELEFLSCWPRGLVG